MSAPPRTAPARWPYFRMPYAVLKILGMTAIESAVDAERRSGLVRAPSTARVRAAADVVLLSGDAGVGKTRLTAEVADVAERRACCSAARRATAAALPYGPVVAALRSHLRSEPGALADVRPAAARTWR